MELVAGQTEGPLRDGDIVVVTSKIISKAEGRIAERHRRDDLVRAESVRTLARRGATKIVRTHHGLTLAAAGIDNSNVEPELIVLLPLRSGRERGRAPRGVAAADRAPARGDHLRHGRAHLARRSGRPGDRRGRHRCRPEDYAGAPTRTATIC